MRSGNYQIGTVAEPLHEAGWQLIDELNRALAGQPPSGYVAPAHLVTKDNIRFDGGPKNIYNPDNNYQRHYQAVWGCPRLASDSGRRGGARAGTSPNASGRLEMPMLSRRA